jgi:glycosyltransferase involved in cell wall biosynthesis
MFRLLVLTNGRMLAAEVEKRGVESVLVKHWSGGAIVNAPTRLRVTRLLRERGASLVHANMAVTLPLVIPAARRLNIPVVTHLHLPFDSLRERHRALVRQSTLTVGVAEHVVATLRADTSPTTRTRVIGNAVNTQRLAGGDARTLQAALGIATGAFVVASVGSLIARKGHHTTLAAVARARAEGCDLHLLLCGDGEEEAALRALAGSLGIAGAVHFLGMRNDVGAVLRDAADLLVSSAREEALPLSLLEAQWLGVPVVASDIAAHREAVSVGGSGLVVPVDDAASLARQLVALARDPARRAAMAHTGRSFARARFDMLRYVREFETLYAEMLTSPVVVRPTADRVSALLPLGWGAVLRST